MSEEEIIESIVEHFNEDGRVDTAYITVEFFSGRPVIAGRVSSDEELQAIDEIMKEVLEVENYENNVWVDDTLAFEGNEDGKEKGVDVDEEEGLDSEEVFEDEDEGEK